MAYSSFGRRRNAGELFGVDLTSGFDGYDQIASNEAVSTLSGLQEDKFELDSQMAAGALGLLGQAKSDKQVMEYLKEREDQRQSQAESEQKSSSGFGRLAGGILGTVISGGNPIGGAIGSAAGSLLPF
jgi:hypothetical protein